MKKFLLSIALVLFAGATMAQTSYSLKFDRKGTTTKEGLTISVINPDGDVVEGVNATLTDLSHVFMETKGDSYRDTIICPNANANTNPTIKLKFETTGLPAGFKLSTIGLDIHPLNNIGNTQSNNTNRRWNVGVNINDAAFGELQDVDIAYGAPYNTGLTFAHKTHYIENANGVATKGSVTIELTITRGTDNPGCYFGLSEIILTGEVETPEPEPEPEPVAAYYHLSGKNLTAAELMAKTEPTYIAIKGIADANKYYFNYVSEQTNTSVVQFDQSAVFVWEPTDEGKFYLKKLENGYMQKDAPGNFAETTDNAVIFEAVQPSTTGTGHLQCNRDGIYEDPGTDYYVRFVATNKDATCWLSLGNHVHSSQNVEYTTTRKGTVTFYQICELKGFEANINVTIKNTGKYDYATFYSNAPVELPEGVTAYYVKEGSLNNGYITLTADEDNIIAGNTGVILSAAVDADTEVALTVLGANVAQENGNLLKGTAENTVINEAAYVLGNKEGIGLYKAETTGEAEGSFLNNAGKAYLPASAVPVNVASSASLRFDFGGTTAIEEVETENAETVIYDLTGRRVNEITKAGVYVVNGKKILVK